MDDWTDLNVRMCGIAEGNDKKDKDWVLVGVSILGKERCEIKSE